MIRKFMFGLIVCCATLFSLQASAYDYNTPMANVMEFEYETVLWCEGHGYSGWAFSTCVFESLWDYATTMEQLYFDGVNYYCTYGTYEECLMATMLRQEASQAVNYVWATWG